MPVKTTIATNNFTRNKCLNVKLPHFLLIPLTSRTMPGKVLLVMRPFIWAVQV